MLNSSHSTMYFDPKSREKNKKIGYSSLSAQGNQHLQQIQASDRFRKIESSARCLTEFPFCCIGIVEISGTNSKSRTIITGTVIGPAHVLTSSQALRKCSLSMLQFVLPNYSVATGGGLRGSGAQERHQQQPFRTGIKQLLYNKLYEESDLVESDYALLVLERAVPASVGYLALASDQTEAEDTIEFPLLEQCDSTCGKTPMLLLAFLQSTGDQQPQLYYAYEPFADAQYGDGGHILTEMGEAPPHALCGAPGIVVRDADFGTCLVGIFRSTAPKKMVSSAMLDGCWLTSKKFSHVIEWMQSGEIARQRLSLLVIAQARKRCDSMYSGVEKRNFQSQVIKIVRINHQLSAVSLQERAVKIVNHRNGEVRRTFSFEGIVRDMCVDGYRLYCAKENEVVMLDWRRELVETRLALQYPLYALLKLESQTLIAGDFKGNIHILEQVVAQQCYLRVTQVLRSRESSIDGHSKFVQCFCKLSANLFVSGSGDGVLKVWDWQQSRLLRNIECHQRDKSVYALVFEKTHSLLVSAGSDCTVRIFDMVRNCQLKCFTFQTKVHSIALISQQQQQQHYQQQQQQSQYQALEVAVSDGASISVINLLTHTVTKIEAGCEGRHSKAVRSICTLDESLFLGADEEGRLLLYSQKQQDGVREMQNHFQISDVQQFQQQQLLQSQSSQLLEELLLSANFAFTASIAGAAANKNSPEKDIFSKSQGHSEQLGSKKNNILAPPTAQAEFFASNKTSTALLETQNAELQEQIKQLNERLKNLTLAQSKLQTQENSQESLLRELKIWKEKCTEKEQLLRESEARIADKCKKEIEELQRLGKQQLQEYRFLAQEELQLKCRDYDQRIKELREAHTQELTRLAAQFKEQLENTRNLADFQSKKLKEGHQEELSKAREVEKVALERLKQSLEHERERYLRESVGIREEARVQVAQAQEGARTVQSQLQQQRDGEAVLRRRLEASQEAEVRLRNELEQLKIRVEIQNTRAQVRLQGTSQQQQKQCDNELLSATNFSQQDRDDFEHYQEIVKLKDREREQTVAKLQRQIEDQRYQVSFQQETIKRLEESVRNKDVRIEELISAQRLSSCRRLTENRTAHRLATSFSSSDEWFQQARAAERQVQKTPTRHKTIDMDDYTNYVSLQPLAEKKDAVNRSIVSEGQKNSCIAQNATQKQKKNKRVSGNKQQLAGKFVEVDQRKQELTQLLQSLLLQSSTDTHTPLKGIDVNKSHQEYPRKDQGALEVHYKNTSLDQPNDKKTQKKNKHSRSVSQNGSQIGAPAKSTSPNPFTRANQHLSRQRTQSSSKKIVTSKYPPPSLTPLLIESLSWKGKGFQNF